MARYDVSRYGERRRGRGRPRDDDQDRRDMRDAYERHGGADTCEDDGRGYWFGDPVAYDPDHAYRARPLRDHDERVAPTIHDQPFSGRAFPGAYGYHGRPEAERPLGPQQFREEHSWRRPSSWYGDKSARGPFRGVGPKGYARSDERVREHVCDALMDDPHLNAADIEVDVKEGEVTLSGTVDSREAKRHAEDLAEQATGVKDVHNQLRIAERE